MSRSLMLLLLAAVVVVCIAGCSKVQTPPAATAPATGAAPATGPVTEITLFTFTPRDEEAANLELINQFQAKHPDIKVKLQNESGGSQNAMAKLQTMIAAKAGPDVMAIHGAFFIPLAAKGALADLGPLAEKDPTIELKDFSEPILKVCKYQDKLYSLPRYTSVYSLFYNKTLFDEAKVAYPGAGSSWTWDDYAKAAKGLTKDTNGDGKPDQFGCIIDFWGSRIYPWLWQNGAALMNADRSKCVLDSPEAIEALTFLRDLRYKDKVAAASDNSQQNSALTAFTQGKVGMYMTGPWDIQVLRQAKGLQWDVAPLPKKKSAATLLGTENYGIWSGSSKQQQAWELFKFLLSAEAQTTMADKLEKMPSRLSVLNGPYSSAKTDYTRKVFVDALGYARQAENIPEWSQVKDLIQDQLDLIWVGQKPVAEGLKTATDNVNKTLKQLRGK
jgi:multiple sugar transport system substrate-binding protein